MTMLGLGASSGVAAPTEHQRKDHLLVTGFQGQWDPVGAINRSAKALDVVGVDGVSVRADGASVPAPDAEARTHLRRAHRLGLKALILVNNFGTDDFSEPIGWRLLHSNAHRRVVAAQLAAAVRRQGWDGVDVDLESLKPRDAAGLVAFLRTLRATLPKRATLTIDLMAATSRAGYRDWGYRLPAIARSVDRVTVMTYDQHGPWEQQPGPVGSLAWADRAIDTLVRAGVPPAKLQMGVAGYGYAWRPGGTVTVSDRAARRLVANDGATAVWKPRVAEWTATLSDGSVIWWSDHRSYRARVSYATKAHLAGVAVWSLAQSDPLP